MHQTYKQVVVLAVIGLVMLTAGPAWSSVESEFLYQSGGTTYIYKGASWPFAGLTKSGTFTDLENKRLLSYSEWAYVGINACTYPGYDTHRHDNYVDFWRLTVWEGDMCYGWTKTMEIGSDESALDADSDGVINSEDTSPNGWLDPSEDADGDGLLNGVDPSPNRINLLGLKTVQYQKDENGNITWALIRDEFGALVELGEKDLEALDYLGGMEMTQAAYSLFATNENFVGLSDEGSLVFGDFQAGTLASGKYNAAGDTDIMLQRKSVDNTGAIVDAEGKIKQGLEAINESLKVVGTGQGEGLGGIEKALNGIQSKLSSIYSWCGGLVENMRSAIMGPTEGQVEALQAEQAAGEAAMEQVLEDAGELKAEPETEEIPEEMRQKKDVSEELESLVGDANPKDFDITVEGSGSCSFTAPWHGHQISFSICAYEGVFVLMGQILLGLSAIRSVFILIGKG